MRYVEFRESIREALQGKPDGLTWAQLRDQLTLPYDRPCPAWTRQLEQEIGLKRARPKTGRALLWRITRSKK